MGVADITTAVKEAPPLPEQVVLIGPVMLCPTTARSVTVAAVPPEIAGTLKRVIGVAAPHKGLTNWQLTDPLVESAVIMPVNTSEYQPPGNPVWGRSVMTTCGAVCHVRSSPVLLTYGPLRSPAGPPGPSGP